MENILATFKKTAELHAKSPCIWHQEGQGWQSISWDKFSDLVWSTAAGLRKSGIKAGDRVAVFGPTAWQWTYADMSLLAAGATVVPIYQTLPPHAVKALLDDASVKMVVGDKKLWDESGHPKVDFYSYQTDGNRCLGDFSKDGSDSKGTISRDACEYDLNAIATIVYTSGTTGDPKGAIITHKNIAAEISAVRKVFLFPPHYIGLACLPLSHVLGRMMQFYQLAHGCQTAYVPDLRKLAAAYKEIRPHYLCAVPRLLEKVEEGIRTELSKRPAFERKIFGWATQVSDEIAGNKQWHREPNGFLSAKAIVADALIYRKIRSALGGRIKSIISGGAPLSKPIAKLLSAAGISILEGYGLTETFAAVTVNRLDDFRIGTVGKAVDGVDLKFSNDSELLIKGDMVFGGYWKKDQATKDAFDEDGWFKTGDLGEFTRDGFVRLTGRKKDVIITSGGKNIEPIPIEDKLKEIPFVAQAILYGDGKKFLSAMLAVDPVRLGEEAAKRKLSLSDDLSSCPVARSLIAEEIDKKNLQLASFERVKKFIILPQPLSIENGELTPTLKVRREILANRYHNQLEAMYEQDDR